MRDWLIVLGTAVALWAAGIALLLALGRRTDARALAGFIPDCLILLRRLLRDPRVPRRRKVVLAVLVAYLAMPFDVVPDFIPVAGQLDDLIMASLALRFALRGGGPALVREHWPGPERTLELVLRAAFARTGGRS